MNNQLKMLITRFSASGNDEDIAVQNMPGSRSENKKTSNKERIKDYPIDLSKNKQANRESRNFSRS